MPKLRSVFSVASNRVGGVCHVGTCRALLFIVLGFGVGGPRALYGDNVLLSTTTYSSAGQYTYTTPTGTSFIVIKAWGAGGGTQGNSEQYSEGGAGGYVTASYTIGASQAVNVRVGQGNASNGGGGATAVWKTSGFQMIAGGGGQGGGNGDESSGSAGSPGGPSGGGGSGPMNLNGGGYTHNGGTPGGNGGAGGSGYYGGPAGTDGNNGDAGGGGGGGSTYFDTGNGYVSSSGSASNGSGTTPPETGNAHYPGGNTGYGGYRNQTEDLVGGFDGAVVILAYKITPTITSATTASGTFGASFSYTITADQSPTSYNATGLPIGLSVNTGSGAITGTPWTAGTFPVTISASNANGAGQATLTLTIAKATQTITFPNPGTRDLGAIFELTASATSGLPITYTVLSGPASVSGSTATITGAGSVTIRASQPGNANFSAASDVSVSFTTGTGTPVADTLLSTSTFTYNGTTAQTYTVPANTDYVIIKAWGGGGGRGSRPSPMAGAGGGNGGFTTATYEAFPGEQYQVSVAGGGSNGTVTTGAGGWPGGGNGYTYGGGGGGLSVVITPRGSAWAGGGGGGGDQVVSGPALVGGSGGYPNGTAGEGFYAGGGATTQNGGAAPAPNPGYAGVAGGWGHGGEGGGVGLGGPPGIGAGGGGGGGGYYGGASGGQTAAPNFPSGWYIQYTAGGGGGSGFATGSVLQASYQSLGSGDSDYASGIAVGAPYPGSAIGGNGRVVIKAYKYNSPAVPAITSPLVVMALPSQQIDYSIAAFRRPTSYSATNLPSGLSLNTGTGRITGSVTSAGTYTSTLYATNATGSGQATITWKIDGAAPNVPTGLTVPGGTITRTSLVLNWTAPTDAMTGIGLYEVRRNGISVGLTPEPTLTLSGLSPGTTYALSVRASDLVGNWSDWTSAYNATTASDTTAPSIPVGLRMRNRTATSIELEWSHSSDDTGVAAYEVRRNGSTSLGESAAAGKLATGLSANTSYTFEVRAKDAAGNWSSWSSVLNATTAAPSTDTLLGRQIFAADPAAVQSYQVPTGTNYVVIKAWGAGGGGAQSLQYPTFGFGGAGAFATASYSVNPGDIISVSVGTGGKSNSVAGWTGGGAGHLAGAGGAGAGGGGTTVVQTPYGTLWSGGGGGASATYGSAEGFGGGAGGGTTGINSGGLTGTYYNSSTFSSLALTRVDSRVGFNWGTGNTPASSMSTPFSVRWTGQVRPRYSESYRFGITTVTGTTRLWVNSQLLFDEGPISVPSGSTATTDRSGTITLTANQLYDIVVEYVHWTTSNPGFAKLWWQSASQPTEVVPSSRLVPSTSPSSPGQGTSGNGWHASGGSGAGATTSAGGAGANSGTNGSQYLGGTGSNNYNGGGGGGYYGGGGGRGGGGGSSFATGSTFNARYESAGSLPGGSSDIDYPGNIIGVGGYMSDAGENGGHGAVVIYAYQTPGSNLTQTYHPTGGNQTYTVPTGADYVIVKAWGAGAGGTGSSGAGGGYVTANYSVSANQTITINAGGGGAAGAAGGSSIVTLPGNTIITAGGGSGTASSINVGSQSPTSSQIIGASGSTPASTSDTNYPGNNTGYGGAPSSPGGNGAVVLIVHIPAPSITSSLSQSVLQGQLVNYTITASNGPTSFGATGLPPGLSVNPATGAITGTVLATATGSYNSTISATNRGGTTQDTLTWNVSADTSAPSVPGTLQSTNITYNSFVLTWAASSDNVATTEYEVSRDDVSMGTTGGLSMTVVGLLQVTNYSMKVRARDAVGNWSAWSSALSVQTASLPSPGSGAPVITSATSYSRLQYQPVDYTITALNSPTFFAASSLPPGVALNPTSGAITGSVANTGNYTSTITAVNSSGSGSATLTWTINADSTVPATPTGLAASNIGATGFVLSWTATTDNVAVTGYEVMRDTTSLGTVAGTSVAVNGLAANTSYALKVRARDAVGNWSSWSSVSSITTATSGGSGGVTGFNYAEVSGSTVTLIWNAPADGLSAASYNVYRGGTLIGSTVDTSFLDRGLSSSTTYTYVILPVSSTNVEAGTGPAISVTTTADFTADTDHDGVPNSVESLLNTSTGTAGTIDSTNQLNVKIHRPSP